MSSYLVLAKKDHIFVLTSEGYEHCKKHCRKEVLEERKVGNPVGEYKDYVPESWIKKGWVKQVKA